MNMSSRRFPPQAAFIPIGIALMVLGITNSTAFIGAGAVFLILGVAAVASHKKARHEDVEADQAREPRSPSGP